MMMTTDHIGLALSFVVEWLPVRDAFSVVSVCQSSKTFLTSGECSEAMWKQVCLNTNKRAAEEARTHYHRLAQGLGRRMVTLSPRKVSSPPKHSLQDIFAVVELYRRVPVGDGTRRRVSVASWTCPVALPAITLQCNTESSVILKGANPYSVFMEDEFMEDDECSLAIDEWKDTSSTVMIADPLKYVPTYFALCHALGVGWFEDQALSAKVTLFRRDSMESVCVMDEAIHIGATLDLENAEDFTDVVGFFWSQSRELRFSSHAAGKLARLFMYDRGYTGIRLEGDVTVGEILPPKGSEQESVWLANMRKAMEDGHGSYFPSHEDQCALSSIPSFDFEIQSFTFKFKLASQRSNIDDACFECEEDLLMALEGLFWQ